MTDSTIYADGKTKVTLTKTEVVFVREYDGRGLRVSRAAMNEICRGYERELEQEREAEK